MLPEQLTEREQEVLVLVARGQRNHEIAGTLRLSIKTVEFHMGNILGKLGVRSRTAAVVLALRTGQMAEPPELLEHSQAG